MHRVPRTGAPAPVRTTLLLLPSLPSRSYSLTNLSVQPGLGDFPVTLHRRRRNLQGGGSFFDVQSAKKSQLDDFALLRINFLQSIQRFVKLNQIQVRIF